MTKDALELLLTRRSVSANQMRPSGPSAADLDHIRRAAARVPDHKKLNPWRFLVFEGEARARAGEIFAEACATEDTMTPSPARLDMERGRFLRAPLVIVVVSSVKPVKTPEWEQVLSAGAACFNTCLAANALGFGTCWITEWIAYSPMVKQGLGLAAHEKIAGIVYIGRASEKPDERERPNLAEVVTYWPA